MVERCFKFVENFLITCSIVITMFTPLLFLYYTVKVIINTLNATFSEMHDAISLWGQGIFIVCSLFVASFILLGLAWMLQQLRKDMIKENNNDRKI